MPDGSTYPRLLGIGLYTVADAARLLHMPAVTARRWLNGYSYSDRGNSIIRPRCGRPTSHRSTTIREASASAT
jgi:hypothetical protein